MSRRKRSGRFIHQLAILLVASFLGLALIGAATAPRPAKTKPTPLQATPSKPKAKSHPMDKPLQLLAQSKKAFAQVKDYECTMVKKERIGGELQQHIISVKIRNQPFSVYMSWQYPTNLVGQEACYVEGANEGKMRVRLTGLKRALGWISIDTNDPRALKNSNHTINEAGLANLLNAFEDSWTKDKAYNKTKVRVGEYVLAKRRAYRVETVRMAKIPNVFGEYRNVLFFDKETMLPVRIERYDWPTEATPQGDLIETYTYLNLKTNVNLPGATFRR